MPTLMPFQSGLITKHDLALCRFKAMAGAADPVPTDVDLRSEMLESNDQGYTSQCVAYAMAGCIEYHNWKQLGIRKQIDPQPIYDRCKQIDGFPGELGTTLEAAVQAVSDLNLLPIDWANVQLVAQSEGQVAAKRALHKNGVLLSGFRITESWRFTERNGWIPAEPNKYLGEHAVALVGYSDLEDPPWIALQNSWGDQTFGWRGFCRMTPQQFQEQFYYGLTWELKR